MKNKRVNRNQYIMAFFAFSLGMVLSNLLGQRHIEQPKKSTAEILFTYKGIDKTLEDISIDKQKKLKQLMQERLALLEYAALEQYLLDYAAAENIDIVKAGHKLFKLEEPSQKEISDFFTAHAEQLNKPFYEVEANIKKQLMIESARAAKGKAISDLIAKGDLIMLPKY